MPHPGRNNIYDAIIRRMVTEAIEAQEKEFADTHGNDSDEQLLDHLRLCAKALGHTPQPREIAGGALIEQRFGCWNNALAKARLPQPTVPDKISCFARYREETERQQAVYREKKAAKRQKAQQRLNAQKEKRNPA